MSYEIYLIEGPDCWYVGSTVRGAHKRFAEHMRSQGHAPLLEQQLSELGVDAFTLTILDDNAADRIEAERYWYDCMLDEHAGQTLNSHRPWTFAEPTPERNAKISASKKGVPQSPEHRAKIGEVQRGRKQSIETRAKRSAALKGHSNWGPIKHTEETKAKMSKSHRGRHPTEATREKLRGAALRREAQKRLRNQPVGDL